MEDNLRMTNATLAFYNCAVSIINNIGNAIRKCLLCDTQPEQWACLNI